MLLVPRCEGAHDDTFTVRVVIAGRATAPTPSFLIVESRLEGWSRSCEVEMSGWRRRVRGVLGLSLLWAGGMAAVGGVIELLDNIFPGLLPFASAVDMWPQTLAIPGFLGGAMFGILLTVVQRRRRFDELSLPGIAAWGAVGGSLLGVLGCALGAPLIFIGISTLVSASAATGSLAIARMAELRQSRDLARGAGEDALLDRESGESR